MQQPLTGRAFTLALLVPVLLAALNFAGLLTQLRSPDDTSTPESLLVYCAQRVQHGQELYQDYHRPPYNYMPYTPLYTGMTGLIARAVNADTNTLILLGRVFSLCCCLLIAFLLYRGGREDQDPLLTGISGAALFLASTILRQWGVTSRPDALALLFSLAGFLTYTRSAARPARFFGLLLFVLAFFTKQSSISAPAALVLWQIAQRRYGEALKVAAGCAIPALILMLVMHSATGGLSTLNIVENNTAPMQWINAKLIAVLFFQAAALPLILAAVGIGEGRWRDAAAFYFVTSLVMAVVSSSKLGSNINYYLEPLAAACLLVPCGVRSIATLPKGTVLAAVLIVVLSVPPLSILVYSIGNPGFRKEKNVRELAQGVDGPLLTDSPRLGLISREQFFIDPFPFGYLERQGKWDSKEAVSMLDQHQIPMVILTLPIEDSSSWQGAKRLPLSIIAAVKRNYTLRQRVDGYHVYAPR